MDAVRDVVNHVLDAKGWRGRVLEQMAVELWPEVVGEQIAQHTLADKYKGGVLWVRARSPQWVHELHFHEARIIARINGRLRREIVVKIRCFVTPPRGIKVGALKPTWEDPTFPEKKVFSTGLKAAVNDEASQRARELANEIGDPDMRAVMERLIATSLRARESDDE